MRRALWVGEEVRPAGRAPQAGAPPGLSAPAAGRRRTRCRRGTGEGLAAGAGQGLQVSG
jgi:hypothetical protein